MKQKGEQVKKTFEQYEGRRLKVNDKGNKNNRIEDESKHRKTVEEDRTKAEQTGNSTKVGEVRDQEEGSIGLVHKAERA